MSPLDSANDLMVQKNEGGSPSSGPHNKRGVVGTGPAPTNTDGGGMDALGTALAGMQMGGGGGVAPPPCAGSTDHGSGAAAAGTAAGGGGRSFSSGGGPVAAATVTPSSLSSPFLGLAHESDWGNFATEAAANVGFPSTGNGGVTTVHQTNHHSNHIDGPKNHKNDVLDPREAYDLFPSPSTSKTLSSDVFRFSHSNLAGIEEKHPQADGNYRYSSSQGLAPGNPAPGTFGEMMRPGIDGGVGGRRRTESPSCSVTGTTTSSRSVSPYTNTSNDLGQGGRVLQAYQRYDPASGTVASSNGVGPDVLARNPSSFAEDDRSSSGYSLSQGHGSHPSLATLDSAHRSPYAANKDWSATANNSNNTSNRRGSGSPYDQALERSSYSDVAASPPHILNGTPTPSGNGQQQPQVLYMAVPSPDGRGQVLQPVQMVQVAGKHNFYVSPVNGNGGPPPAVDGLPPLANHGGGGGGNSELSLYGALEPMNTVTAVNSRSRVANYALGNSANRAYGSDAPFLEPDDYARSPSVVAPGGGPYPVDSAVAQLYAAPQRPPLDALLGQVRRLSRDQVGCRLVQQALDEEGPMAATLILNEGLQFWGEAMVDPFGNYLFQKILEKITSEERILLVKTVSPRLVNASLNLHGTRSVQKVVELCAHDESLGRPVVEESAADVLTAALEPAAARLCIDSHGNHVIQRILLKLGPKHTKFVFDAVAASVGDVARHRHGCCVIQRCLDSPPNKAREHLVRRIVEKSLELMQDAYGNYVVQYVLDVCSDDDVAAVCESVIGRVNLLAIQKFSSNVMEKCLERCSDRVKEHYLAEMSDPERIRELMMDPFGNYVVQRALSVATHTQAIRLVEAMKPHLLATQATGPLGHRSGGVRNTAGGRRIIAKICRRFPNFTLSAVATNDELYSSNRMAHRHHQAPVLGPSYVPLGPATSTMTHNGQLYSGDPFAANPFATDSLMSQTHALPQTYYTLGGTPYYEPQYSGGHAGFPGT